MIRPPAKDPTEMKLLRDNDLFLLKGIFTFHYILLFL